MRLGKKNSPIYYQLSCLQQKPFKILTAFLNCLKMKHKEIVCFDLSNLKMFQSGHFFITLYIELCVCMGGDYYFITSDVF